LKEIESDELLDVKGLNCPLPILKTKATLRNMSEGQVLHVLATDPMSVIDFRAYCARFGHDLLHYGETDGVFEFYIRCINNK
jgi:tRNA 2-thiouridine synthesizing protein A